MLSISLYILSSARFNANCALQGIVEAFVEILTSGAPTFGSILRQLITSVTHLQARPSSPAPALFMHCTTGNNRTGVFISLLLLLLHVPATSVCEEYALSE